MGGKVIRTRTTLKLPTVDIAVMMTDLSVDGGAGRRLWSRRV